jgi:type I restriction enzyme S subunit
MTFASWESLTLGDLGKWVTGSTPSSADNANKGSDVLFVTPGDIGFGGKLGDVARRISNLGADRVRRIKPGSVILVCIGTIGKVAWTDREITTNQQINTLEVDQSKFDIKFVHWLLASPAMQEQLWQNSTSTTVPLINKKTLEKIPCSVPPLEEQRRIAEALDDRLSRLAKALAEAGYAAKATMRFSASLLHSMFTGDLMQRELGIQDINLVELSDVAEIQSGGTPKGLDRLTSDVASESHTIPFYKVGDMNLDSRYMLASRAYLTSADVEKLSLKVIPVGSVIFPKAGGAIATDKKRLVKVPGPIDLNCMAVTPSSQLLPSYLAWWFESFKLSDLSNGSILPQIGKTSVMQVRLPCPSLSEQEQVVHYLEENITQVRAQAQNIDGVAASIETLRRSILNVLSQAS